MEIAPLLLTKLIKHSMHGVNVGETNKFPGHKNMHAGSSQTSKNTFALSQNP